MNKLVKRGSGTSFFDEFFDNFFTTPNYRNGNSCMKTDILDVDNGYELHVDVPGFDKDEIKISLDKGYLTIEAKNETDNEEKESHYVKRERFIGSAARSFFVGEDIAEKDIKASYEKGILKLFIPKEGTNVKQKKYISIE